MSQAKQEQKISNVWNEITSFEWLIEAHRHARLKKRRRPEVMEFTDKLEDNILKIQELMRNGTYEIGPYRRIKLYVPKERIAMALDYPDRIAQWAVYLCINPFYDKQFIEDSYACRKNKGTIEAVNKLQRSMRLVSRQPGEHYYLKLDISKYFYRVNHEKLIEILSRKIEDKDLLDFLVKIINSNNEKFGLPRWRGPNDTPIEEWLSEVGMPVGNLTSQLFANIYLNELDQYCKHVLHIRYYYRYADDIIILGDKEQLKVWEEKIRAFLLDELLLDLNDKTAIRPISKGAEFIGMKVSTKCIKIRKSTVGRIKREMHAISMQYAMGEMSEKDFNARIQSFKGLLDHVESGNLKDRLNKIYIFEKEKTKRQHGSFDNVGAA